MKKALLTILILLPFAVSAQGETDTVRLSDMAKEWRFVPMPVVGYNSDLGIQLGASCQIYCYGDRSVNREYLQKFSVGGSYHFKGSGNMSFLYDSKYLIPKTRFTTSFTYISNPIMSFYGLNGAAAPYHAGLNSREGVSFYSMKRNSLRIVADFLGNIRNSFNWAAGFVFRYYDVGPTSLKKYREQAGYSLFNLYREYGVINDKEAEGGNHLELRTELVFDTRDHEEITSRGVWAEMMLCGSPDLFRSGSRYLKIAVHFRHYVPVWEDKIVFAYHLAWQGIVAGQQPFYLLSDISTPFLRSVYSEGLGGASTLRGMRSNRIVGKGVAWANAELRVRIVKFRILGQQWFLSVNPLFDVGMVVQPFRLDEMKLAETRAREDGIIPGLIYSGHNERPHLSAGIGAKLAIERNLIFSAEWVKSFDKQEGTRGINIGANYIF